MFINRNAVEVDNHIPMDDIFDYHPLKECNIYVNIPNRTLVHFKLSTVFLLGLPLVKGVPKAI